MIDKINPNQIRDILEQSAPQTPESAKPQPESQADASLQVDFAALIENAVQPPQPDERAVQRARELLESGRLDTPQNTLAAAQNIFDYGI